ncbi:MULTISPECIES: DUF2007 domain-containing protein [unclassified Microbulbifer]|uniref:DUF2007 domain-containing protein n=1 Tax=Microbulbifer spongiae TaxID=2944933 RepID=A0ABY9ED22_9GAMM|nr:MULTISPECIES: DUF2007 domain-containing protein [unclassified Microbulbifer]MDP5209664.1 DUF2007 domain-containing protein [Microbulbifer sp. 2205BS26-8]WKD50246.1 DUF2007 domain-containing protein [Microbulbifer sp. MI-G]
MMKLIYTHENRLLVELAKSRLEVAGIPVFLKNAFAQGASGELAPNQVWPELWLERDRDFEHARRLLEDVETGQGWPCPVCGEENGAAFDFCWQCGGTRPTTQTPR